MYKVTIQDTEKGKVIVDEEVRGMVMTSLPANQFGDEAEDIPWLYDGTAGAVHV